MHLVILMCTWLILTFWKLYHGIVLIYHLFKHTYGSYLTPLYEIDNLMWDFEEFASIMEGCIFLLNAITLIKLLNVLKYFLLCLNDIHNIQYWVIEIWKVTPHLLSFLKSENWYLFFFFMKFCSHKWFPESIWEIERSTLVIIFDKLMIGSFITEKSCEFEFRSWRGVLDTTLCDKVCQRSVVFSRYSSFLHQ